MTSFSKKCDFGMEDHVKVITILISYYTYSILISYYIILISYYIILWLSVFNVHMEKGGEELSSWRRGVVRVL